MSKLSNKIEAHDRSITEVLDDKKYTVDYFQRELENSSFIPLLDKTGEDGKNYESDFDKMIKKLK